jgi:hypothetical protein
VLVLAQTSEKDWMVGTPMPTPRTEVTSINLDDGIHVIGGLLQTVKPLLLLKCITSHLIRGI